MYSQCIRVCSRNEDEVPDSVWERLMWWHTMLPAGFQAIPLLDIFSGIESVTIEDITQAMRDVPSLRDSRWLRDLETCQSLASLLEGQLFFGLGPSPEQFPMAFFSCWDFKHGEGTEGSDDDTDDWTDEDEYDREGCEQDETDEYDDNDEEEV